MAVQTKYNIHDDLIALAVPIGQLDMLPGNPNQGDVEAIARSYKKWGQRKPVVGRRMPGDRWEVSAGNHQLLAARDVLGWTHLALVRTEDNEAEGQAFAIADNHTARMGEDDKGALLAMMESVNNADSELLAAASYTENDLDALRHSAEGEGIGTGDASPQLGDLQYQLIVECDGEVHQAELMEKFSAEGLNVRPLTV